MSPFIQIHDEDEGPVAVNLLHVAMIRRHNHQVLLKMANSGRIYRDSFDNDEHAQSAYVAILKETARL